MAGLSNEFDSEYEGKSVEELAKAPVGTLQGLSESDAQKLQETLGIRTIKDLGTNKNFLWAQAVAKLAE